MSFWIKICPECEQGRLIVMKEGDKNLFLLCEECENAWQAPNVVGACTEAFLFKEEQIKNATIEDIHDLGWHSYKIVEDGNLPENFDPMTYWA